MEATTLSAAASTSFEGLGFLVALALSVVLSFLLDFLLAALVGLAVFCVAGVRGWVSFVFIPSLFANAMAVPSSEDSLSIPPVRIRPTILAILSLAPPLVDILVVGSFVVDMVMTVGSTLKHLVAIEFKAPGSCWAPAFQ